MSQVSDKILKRVYLLFGAVALFSAVILYRVVKIQFFEKDRWVMMVDKDRITEHKIKAARGNIMSDEGKVLATSQPSFHLPIDPSLIDVNAPGFDKQLDSLSKLLAARFGSANMDAQNFHDLIMEKINSKDKHMFLVRQAVDFADWREMRTWPILRNSRFEGGLIEDKWDNTRFYPFDSLGRITLGILYQDSVPVRGLEIAFDSYLRGTDGIALVQRMPGGDYKPLEIFQEDEDGADLITTINIGMQEIVETELRNAVRRHDAKFGAAILMEVETGEIKAMANYPETQNRAAATLIEPGSTFKLASFMALIEDRRVSLDDSIDTGNGTHKYYDKIMRDHVGMGKMTVRYAFEHSSNVAISKLIVEHYGNRVERWFSYLDKFALTKPVMRRQHLKGEPEPVIVHPGQDEWSGTTLPWMSIGYNSQLTPLQICTFYNAVANDGRMMEPILVREIRKGTKVLQKFEPRPLNPRIASERTIKAARDLMEGVVLRGTGKSLQIPECQLAGKTGTAQKFIDSLGRYDRVYQASFAGYFPADNPKYTCYVVIDEPSNGEFYGASVAGPVFRNIAQQVYTADMDMIPLFQGGHNRNAARPVTRVVHQGNAEAVYRKLDINAPDEAEGMYVRAREADGKIDFEPVEIVEGRVPNVKGMSGRDAMSLLESMGLRVQLKGSGKVVNQSLASGEVLEPRKTIELELK